MRGLKIGGYVAELLPGATWKASDPDLTAQLDRLTERVLGELSPADGDPLANVLLRVQKQYPGSEILNNEPPRQPHEEVVY